MVVRRLLLAFVVSVLALSATGVANVVVLEPCTNESAAAPDDAACPPMCVTCGCCAQAVEPVTLTDAGTPQAPTTLATVPLPPLPMSEPRGILHVPRVRLA
jgi:hypothetical protein